MKLEKSGNLDNTYKLFGVCAHHCSNIEYHIAFLLHPVKWKKHRNQLESKKQNTQKGNIKERVAAMKEFDKALEKVEQDIDSLYKLPLGALIEQLSINYPLTEKQGVYLKKILEKRNYVIHRMWGNYGRRLKDALVVGEMYNELQNYEQYFRSASNWLKQQAYLFNSIPDSN